MNSKDLDRIFEHLILGSGAGGATAFLEFAGESTLLLEEGSEISQSDLLSSEVTRIRNFYRNGGIRPALGLPSVAIGEGFCLGGSTEVNGGLFWRTPPSVLAEWKSNGDDFANSDQVSDIFQELEYELGVIQESAPHNTDADSRLMLQGSRSLNFKVVPATRMVRGCKKANQCPSGCPNGAKQSMSKTFISQGKEKGEKFLQVCAPAG
jgi:choline dehydrogenase-like flavoprotein